jgi:3-hydroxymyristoyl/3-hydroxydecanoyl-(acyl carrier protein) dehydratase
MSLVLEFFGEPFDAVAWMQARPEPGGGVPSSSPRPVDTALLSRLRAVLTEAHSSALRAQTALQLRQLANPRPASFRPRPALAGPRPAQSESRPAQSEPRPAQSEPRPVLSGISGRATDEVPFKPLARSAVTGLAAADLARLAAGDIAGVFGPAYDQEDCNPDVRLAAGTELVLAEITTLAGGRLRARCAPGADLLEATTQAAQVLALFNGLHLVLADAGFVRLGEDHPPIEPATAGFDTGLGTELDVEVEEIDLLPRPWLQVTARIGSTRVMDLVVALREKPGVPVGPALGGVPERWLGRKSSRGEHTLLSEFHLAHLGRGDQGIAYGPEFAHYTGKTATRVPNGSLTFVDRLVTLDGERGTLDGATYLTEYDSPADTWYYAETANASMPNIVYLETSLQAALTIGYYLGPTLSTPDEALRIRNLGGTATVLREVDLRDTTIRQDTTLTSTSPLPGATLQTFTYTLSTDDEPFYAGETMFGYFSDQALENQNGLDSGRYVPTWLEAERPTGLRTIDVAQRRADPAAALCSRNRLALIDELTVVDGGGRYGKGYLHSQRRIDPDDWFFVRHFHLDAVVPGSLGVETAIQAMQEWLLDSEPAGSLRDPGFVLPVGVPVSWKYRGQFLPTDGETTLEVHVKEIQTRPGRVRLIADASLWKPGLRVYELTDLAVELREKGAQPW